MVLRYLKHWDKLTLRDGILYRVSRDQVSKTRRFQYVVPVSLVDVVLRSVHEDSGHQGQYRSVSLAKQRFFLAKHGAQNTRSCATLSTLHCE